MEKLKLTDTQKKHFLASSQALAKAREQAQIASGILNNSANQFDSIIEMIGEAHGIDLKTFPPGTPMNLDKEGNLCIGQPPKASERIKEVMRKNGKSQKSHSKNAKMKIA